MGNTVNWGRLVFFTASSASISPSVNVGKDEKIARIRV